ncbi:hypothetical protein HNY73_017857 [Argiope bruennichi]|uniref:SOCS box domain-containing protein n=1 Tax=Argiope bruennichi TaxID=94029 RepID=A0A8T0EBZ0_ARGBR|nr:hypothetical protein HNY73_017857 [Argiope bruennichi]
MKRKLSYRFHSIMDEVPPIKYIFRAKSMVKYSFIVQKSLSYLDLSLCEFTKSKRSIKRLKLAHLLNLRVSEKNAIHTEEDCKKRFCINRSVLYDFHLDVSKELETSLRSPVHHQKIRSCSSEKILLNMIDYKDNIHDLCLNRIIAEVLEETEDKVKFIHTVSKLLERMNFLSNECIRVKGLAYLCFQCSDSNIIKDFLTSMNFSVEDFFHLSIHIFERILYHAHRAGYDLWTLPVHQDPIHSSICYCMFVKTEALFQYYSAPRFCEVVYNRIKNGGPSLRICGGAINFPVENGLMTEERHLLILEIALVFALPPSDGLTALQMLWRSIPDPFITFPELTSVLPGVPSPKLIEDITNFTKQITGEDVTEDYQPRRLKHYCRTTIRNILSNNNNNNMQFSTKISELRLPPAVDSYMRLQN